MANILTLTVTSTHFYLVACPGGYLLVDAGWEPQAFGAQLRKHKVAYSELKWITFTHWHPDHAGLVQYVREKSGARLILHAKQIPYLEELRKFSQKKGGAYPIAVSDEDLISPDRDQMRKIGVPGVLVETPGHSDDHVTLVLESGEAFTGDLMPPSFAPEDIAETVRASWQRLIDAGARVFYPSHSSPVPVEQIKREL